MTREVVTTALAFLIGSFFLTLSIKSYKSSAKTEKIWQGKPISLELDGIIQDGYSFSFLLFFFAVGFYGFGIYSTVVAMKAGVLNVLP